MLPVLMTKSKLVSDPLSATAKSKLDEIWREEVWERKNYDKKNKYTDKGIECEPDAFDLLQHVTGKTYFKNKETFQNGYISGTPDIITRIEDKKHIRDTKCSWSMETYMKSNEKSAYSDYYFQQLGYMWLTGAVSADVDYCLVNTPQSTMENELYRMSFDYPVLTGSDEEKIAPFKKNFVFDDVPEEYRLKSFRFEFNQEDVDKLIERIGYARQYLSTLKL